MFLNMTPKEKESIIILSKYLAVCKNDGDKFSIMRNYLHTKISNLLEYKRKQSLKVIS